MSSVDTKTDRTGELVEWPGMTEGTQTDGAGNDPGRFVSFHTETNQTNSGLVEQSSGQLLPGFPDEITLREIVPKLSWSDFCVLPRVSRAWQQAIQSRHARLKETFVVLIHQSFGGVDGLSLYSMKDRRCYHLPPIPFCRRIPWRSRCVALDGKLYFIEGGLRIAGNVYVFDMAERSQWKRCANMQQPRQSFGCGVMNGKIYVFGGTNRALEYLKSCEVYDPTTNTWSWIRSMRYSQSCQEVVALREELFVFGRSCDGEAIVYHPGKNKWTSISRSEKRLRAGSLFIARGKLHSIGEDGISVHDFQKNTWTLLQSSLSLPIAYEKFKIKPILGVDDELLATCWYDGVTTNHRHIRLLQSEGFGSNDIVWEEVNCRSDFSILHGSPCLFQT